MLNQSRKGRNYKPHVRRILHYVSQDAKRKVAKDVKHVVGMDKEPRLLSAFSAPSAVKRPVPSVVKNRRTPSYAPITSLPAPATPTIDRC